MNANSSISNIDLLKCANLMLVIFQVMILAVDINKCFRKMLPHEIFSFLKKEFV